MKKIFRFPILVIFRDRTIDAAGAEKLVISFLYVRKGKVLTIKGVDTSRTFTVEMSHWSVVRGDVRIARKPVEMSVEEIRERIAAGENLPEVENTSPKTTPES